MQFDRHIPLQGASNFRDFGGYRTVDGRLVARGRLFRSDRLSDLTPQDYTALAAYGIRYVYDLRRGSEREAWPTRWHGEGAPELIHAPMFPDGASHNLTRRAGPDGRAPDAALARQVMVEMNYRMVTEPHPIATLGRIFGRLAREDAFPALFHCAAGKDRTGVTCALILSSLGVSRDDIVEDFMLTGKHYDAAGGLDKNITQAAGSIGEGGWTREALLPVFGVDPTYIGAALDQVEAEGGIEAFLRDKLAIGPDALERLRGQLLV